MKLIAQSGLAALLFTATAVGLLAWSTPPTAIFVGRIISARKESDVSFHKNSAGGLEREVSTANTNDAGTGKPPHIEIWKAEVKVLRAVPEWPGLTTNLANIVWVYYNQDSSTNLVTPYGAERGRPSRLRLNTNAVYRFICGQWDVGADETNTFRAFEAGITPE